MEIVQFCIHVGPSAAFVNLIYRQYEGELNPKKEFSSSERKAKQKPNKVDKHFLKTCKH